MAAEVARFDHGRTGFVSRHPDQLGANKDADGTNDAAQQRKRAERSVHVIAATNPLDNVGAAHKIGHLATERLAVEHFGLVDLEDLSCVHDGYSIGDRQRLLLVVRDEDAGEARLAQASDDLGAHLIARRLIEARERFVQQHELGLLGEGASEGDALLLPSGQFGWSTLSELLDVEHCEQLAATRSSIFALGLWQCEADVLDGCQVRKERVVLKHHRHATILWSDPRIAAGDDTSLDGNGTQIGTNVAGDQVEQRRLTTARGTENAKDLAAVDLERDPVERHRVAKPTRHRFELQAERSGHTTKGTLNTRLRPRLRHAVTMSAWQNDGGTEFTPRLIAVVAIVAILALSMGFASGMYFGRSSSPNLQTLADQARSTAKAVSVELAPAKPLYGKAVPAGTVENVSAYADAQARIIRARANLTNSRTSLTALAPGSYGRTVAAFDALISAAGKPVDAATFDRLFQATLDELAVLSGS